MTSLNRVKTLAILFIFTTGILALSLPTIFAANPNTKMSPSPSHTTEGSMVSIIISLSNYPSSHHYLFNVTVTNPINANASAVNQLVTVNTAGAGTLTLHYPNDFKVGPTPTTNLNGTYTSRVTFSNVTMDLGPIPSPVSFSVGPTDKFLYQRTQKVNIIAAGYTPGMVATVRVTNSSGAPVGGYPRSVTILPNSSVIDSWSIPAPIRLGIYVVNVTGPQPITKTVNDVQQITVVRAILSISNINPASSSAKIETTVFRGNVTFALFNVTYPDGTAVKNVTSTSLVSLIDSSGTQVKVLSASYNTNFQAFFSTAPYTFPVGAPTGTWTFRVVANKTNDGNGNIGPAINTTNTFQVNTLPLQTSITSLKTTYNRTAIIEVTATVSYPISYPFNSSSGIVYANLTSGTNTVKQNLTYIGSNKWTGNITIPPDFPLGSATLQVSAHDKVSPPNVGTDTSHHVTISPTAIIVRQIPFNINGTGTFQPFQTFAVQINATYINNQTLLQGPGGFRGVTFTLPGGRSISVALTLQSNHTLTGFYTIRENDPLGTWNLTLAEGRLNDGYGNTNTKSILGPIIKILSLPLTYDSSSIPNIIVAGDKINVGVAFRYPNSTSTRAQNLAVNGTVLINGQNMTFTFTFDPGSQMYIARIDTSLPGWGPGQYQLNIYAYSADYRGYHSVALILQAAPFPVGSIIGAVLVVIVLGLGYLEYTRRKVPSG